MIIGRYNYSGGRDKTLEGVDRQMPSPASLFQEYLVQCAKALASNRYRPRHSSSSLAAARSAECQGCARWRNGCLPRILLPRSHPLVTRPPPTDSFRQSRLDHSSVAEAREKAMNEREVESVAGITAYGSIVFMRWCKNARIMQTKPRLEPEKSGKVPDSAPNAY